jgi:predicted dinucleotide-binding enzyme
MSYAIFGFGKIGQALAKAFARSGIEVSLHPLLALEEGRKFNIKKTTKNKKVKIYE